MAVSFSAVRRGGLVLGVALLGLALSSAAHLWWGTTGAALLGIAGVGGTLFALTHLYGTRRPLRLGNVPLTLGFLAVFVLYGVGVAAALDIAMTLVGIDAHAVVDRTWVTRGKASLNYHCTLRHEDGTPIPREFASNCEGRERGDTIPVVLDPRGRFPPVRGPKADLPAVGETQIAGIAGLVLLASTAIGSVPARAPSSGRRNPPARK
ncbi:hypothetical protein [Microtetraspora sp. NBRC 16547]|uniref:hypothetical protein n=1 Tax=Microtetraspora sp. NBRC 16547 TaxID=3030993 RepID=UPI0024A5EADC|nr:hypothetical protein [Microtetraspora sp. NBRC 16547]GLW99598.1 hypothetical protein Misp02_36850 [Microtetraspora sp. NBRC 16547]